MQGGNGRIPESALEKKRQGLAPYSRCSVRPWITAAAEWGPYSRLLQQADIIHACRSKRRHLWPRFEAFHVERAGRAAEGWAGQRMSHGMAVALWAPGPAWPIRSGRAPERGAFGAAMHAVYLPRRMRRDRLVARDGYSPVLRGGAGSVSEGRGLRYERGLRTGIASRATYVGTGSPGEAPIRGFCVLRCARRHAWGCPGGAGAGAGTQRNSPGAGLFGRRRAPA